MKFLSIALFISLLPVSSFGKNELEKERSWSNTADISAVMTTGNSSMSTLSVDNKFSQKWTNSDFRVSFGGLRAKTTDEVFAIGTTNDFDVITDSKKDLDNERYYVSSTYQRNLSSRFYWITGIGWEKDSHVGIENRTMAFGSIGNSWIDATGITFSTDYGITFTKRIDSIPDPERREVFPEARIASNLWRNLNTSNQIDSEFIFFFRISDLTDYRFNITNTLTSSLGSIFALRFSVQFLYHNLPALEAIELKDFDDRILGKIVVRKKKLDSLLKFSFVITI